jgi:hypothetical protein
MKCSENIILVLGSDFKMDFFQCRELLTWTRSLEVIVNVDIKL